MKFPKVTTIDEFCDATGWDRREFGELRWSQVMEVLSWYDLRLDFTCVPRDTGERCSISPCGMCEKCDAGGGR